MQAREDHDFTVIQNLVAHPHSLVESSKRTNGLDYQDLDDCHSCAKEECAGQCTHVNSVYLNTSGQIHLRAGKVSQSLLKKCTQQRHRNNAELQRRLKLAMLARQGKPWLLATSSVF